MPNLLYNVNSKKAVIANTIFFYFPDFLYSFFKFFIQSITSASTNINE